MELRKTCIYHDHSARLFHQVLFQRALFLDKFEKSPILWLFVGDFYAVTSDKQIHLP